MLEPDGSLHLDEPAHARGQLDTYVLRGGGREVFEPRFTFHGFRYVEVTGIDEALDADRPRRALRHAAQRRVRVLRRARQPALAQHQLGPARQLPLGPDRLPAARRAARLARRRAGLPAHRDAEHGRRRVHHQVGRRHPRRAVARRRVPRRRAAARCSSATARRRGPTPGSSCRGRSGSATATCGSLERHWDAMERYMAYLLRHNPDLLWTARRGNDYGDWLSVGAAHAARGARDRVLGLRREAHGARWRGVLGRADRAAHYERLRTGDRRRVQPRLRRRGRLHRGRHADGLPAGAAHGSAPGRAARARGRAAGRRTSSATTGTSRPASSASGCCAPC